MLELEVLVGELLAVDGLATSALEKVLVEIKTSEETRIHTLPRVKSPPWSMNSGMTRWNLEPE